MLERQHFCSLLPSGVHNRTDESQRLLTQKRYSYSVPKAVIALFRNQPFNVEGEGSLGWEAN